MCPALGWLGLEQNVLGVGGEVEGVWGCPGVVVGLGANGFSLSGAPGGLSLTPLVFLQCRIRPSAFKAVAGKGLVSMQGLSSSKGQKLSKSNGSLHTLLSQSSTAPSQHGPLRTHLLHAISLDEASDSSHNSIQSFPSYGSRLKPAQSQFSASMGHINHIGGSLDRVSRNPRDPLAPEKAPLSCKSMATLSRLQSPGEPPPPYEFTYSLEDAVKQLEDRLQESGGELRQLKRSLSETEDPFTQVRRGAGAALGVPGQR